MNSNRISETRLSENFLITEIKAIREKLDSKEPLNSETGTVRYFANLLAGFDFTHLEPFSNEYDPKLRKDQLTYSELSDSNSEIKAYLDFAKWIKFLVLVFALNHKGELLEIICYEDGIGEIGDLSFLHDENNKLIISSSTFRDCQRSFGNSYFDEQGNLSKISNLFLKYMYQKERSEVLNNPDYLEKLKYLIRSFIRIRGEILSDNYEG